MGLLGILVSVATFVLGVMIARSKQMTTDGELHEKLDHAAEERQMLIRQVSRLAHHLHPSSGSVTTSPEKDEIFDELVRSYLDNHRLDRAQVTIQEWGQECPDSWRRALAEASVLEHSPVKVRSDASDQEWQAARDQQTESIRLAYGKAMSLAPQEPQAVFEFGRWLLESRRGSIQQAVQLFADLVDVAPAHRDGLYYLLYCQWKLGRHEEALDTADRLLEIDPFHDKVRAIRAEALRSVNRTEDAVKEESLRRIITRLWRMRWAGRSAIGAALGLVVIILLGTLGEGLGATQEIAIALLFVFTLYCLGVFLWSMPEDNTLSVSPQLRDVLDTPRRQPPVEYHAFATAFDAIMPRAYWLEHRGAVDAYTKLRDEASQRKS